MLTIKKFTFSLLIIIFAFSVFKSAFAITETGVEITQLQEDSITKNSITLSGEYTFENWGLKYPYGLKFVYGEDPDNLNLETENILTEDITPPFTGVRTFTYTITGLTPNTSYFYNIKDTNTEVLGEYMPVTGSFITEALVIGGTVGDTKVNTGGKDISNVGIQIGNNATTINTGTNCVEEDNNEYCFLAPLPGFSDKIDASFGFGDYVNSLITLAIGIAIVLAILMIVIGGVQYMSTDAFSGKQEGRERITNALIGLVIALGAYTILNTISPNLVNFNVSVKTVSFEADPIDFSEPPVLNADNTYAVAVGQQELDGQIYKTGWAWPNDTPDIRSYLESQGIEVTATKGTDADCDYVGEKGCTSVKFDSSISGLVLDKIETLRAACNCTLVVTGGSEFWLHKTHGPGAKAIDFSVTSGLTEYITGSSSFPSSGSCKWYPLPASDFGGKGCALAEHAACGAAAHWHINFDRDPNKSCQSN
ncbi:fibronectin type III domain-containing protein [Candidatus Nomurabacteria bacterium]|nr:fibronectin type III domain-containing protein [Candidatus Nomurabacteria bacterium]MCB9820444.1 fibronectin type III domain-containing protein [Candidatus Nomurabacteria bacterium]